MNKELLELLNKYINREFQLSYLYFAMSTYFDGIIMDGFSKYMKHRASVGLMSAQNIYDYLILRGERLSFDNIKKPSVDWTDVSDIFSSILNNERIMYNEMEKIYDFAIDKEDKGVMEFTSKMLEGKQKTLSQSEKLVLKMKSASNDFSAIGRY